MAMLEIDSARENRKIVRAGELDDGHWSYRLEILCVCSSMVPPQTCSAPHPPSASLMFCGGSIDGMNSRIA